MSPGCFLFEEVGKKDFAAVIVERRDQSPLGLSIRGPAVERSIVLDEGADSCGDDLATMGLLFWTGLVAAQGFGSFDDRRQRHFIPEILQPFPDGGVVERGDRQAGVSDHRPLFQEAFSDQALSLSLQSARRAATIGQRKTSRVLPIELEQSKEAGLAYPQDLFDLRPLHKAFFIAAKQIPCLLVGKTSVNLCHSVLLSEDYSSGVHFSTLNCSLFSLRQQSEKRT